MIQRNLSDRRKGAVLPLVAICLIGLMGLVALAIDIGMIAVARTEAQNAADSSAMAGARTINGNSADNYGTNTAPTNAIKAANANQIMGQQITGNPNEDWTPTDASGNIDVAAQALVHPNDATYITGQVKVEVGAYAYAYNDENPSAEGFTIQIPRTDTKEPFSAVRSTISYKGNFAFGRIFGMNNFNVTATSVAVHRPRDVVIIMDLSGSMRFQSLPGIPYSGARTTSMNPESVFPQFGHYSNISAAALQGTSAIPTGGGEYYDPANISVKTNSGSAILEDFFKNNKGVPPDPVKDRAFVRSNDSYATAPGGDDFLKTSNDTGGSYATRVSDVTGSTSRDANFEANGYQQYRTNFYGYTEGPGYWGKTFVAWPPDPRGPASATSDPTNPANHADNGSKDWRQRFFFKYNTSTGALGWLDHNSILWQTSSGTTPVIKTPHGTSTTVSEVVNGVSTNVTYRYRINYAAILKWLQESPSHFPSQIRAGRIKYYDALPDSTDTSLNDRWWTTQTLSNLNERFWREYIDFVLGVEVNGKSSGYVTYTTSSGPPLTAMIGNGDFFTWGTFKVSQRPNPASQSVKISGGTIGTAASANATALSLNGLSTAPAAGDTIRITISGTNYYYSIEASPAPTTTSVTIKAPGLAVGAPVNSAVAILNPAPYMDYADNPKRARHQYWFGPMTWVDWLGNYNTGQFWWPGNVHEAQNWACKVGIQSAIDDIRNNHPSDFIALCYFSSPKYTSKNGQYNAPVVPLGRSYQQLKDQLWFPPSTVTGGVTEITPYDSDMANVPRANGSTSPGMGLMIAYNLLSSSATNLRTYPDTQYRGAIGGLGRRGASRLVILETDGAPNTGSTAGLGGSGSDQYYKIRLYNPANYNDAKNTEWPSNPSYSNTDVYNVVDQICADVSAGGYSSKRKPIQVYCIAYGSLFDPANSSTTQQNALGFLQTIQNKGNTAATTDWSDFPADQRIYGPNEGKDGRIERMQRAFTKIMQAGVQVSVIQ